MRKLVAVITFLAILVLPAAAMAQPRWHRGAKSQVTVYMEKTRVGATNWSYVKRSGIDWGAAAAASTWCSSTAAPPGITA